MRPIGRFSGLKEMADLPKLSKPERRPADCGEIERLDGTPNVTDPSLSRRIAHVAAVLKTHAK
jgi:hypothetical protein